MSPVAPEVHRPPSYVDLIVTALERYPDRELFAADHGYESLSYGEILARASQVTQALSERGLRKGEGLAVISGNRPEAFLVVIAALALGCRYTILNPLGSAEDHAFMLEDGEISALVHDPSAFDERAADLVKRVPGVRHSFSLGPSSHAEDLLASAETFDAEPLPRVVEADDVAIVQYTGGTTGQPKGVVLTHRALVHGCLQMLAEWQWPREVRFLALTQLAQALLVPIALRGGTAVLQGELDPGDILATMERHRVTATYLVPAVIYALLDHPDRSERDLSSLETVVYAGSPISPPRLKEAVEALGPVFMQVYGQTEALFGVTIFRKEEHDLSQPERLSSCGRPLAGTELQLQDDDGREVMPGEPGEICLRGPLIMEGYWKQEELTAETTRGGWLHTGDVARADEEGFLHIIDRKKDMIITSGFNVFPREVEDVLTDHPTVLSAAVIGIPDEQQGEAVKAIVVPQEGVEVDVEELIGFVRERKGELHAPSQLEVRSWLPLTAAGKPDKKLLREEAWAASGRLVG